MRYFVSVFILTVLLLLWPEQVSAKVVFEDDFSAGLDKWQLHQGQDAWQVTAGKAEGKIMSQASLSELVPKDEYWQNWDEYSFEFEYLSLVGVDRNISFLVQNPENWFELHFYTQGHNLVQWENNQLNDRFNFFAPLTITNNITYFFKVVVTQQKISGYVNGELIFDQPRPPGSSGKIGLKVTTGSVAPSQIQIDNVVVRTLDDSELLLDVPLYKQTDPIWSWKEYDTASRWSPAPTLQTWGCALSSAAMVLRYYGINQLPDLSNTNPDSLNSWLIAQPDGYLEAGLVNWLAITRLSQQMHDRIGTTKLEFHRQTGNNLTTVKDALRQSQPNILELPGHFVTARGITANNDLYVHDPFWSLTRLSEYQQPVISSRIFTPSHTDLSYIMIVAPEGTELTLLNQEQRLVGESYLEKLKDPATTQETTAQVLVLPKPSTGRYSLVARGEPGNDLTIYTYDQFAQVSLTKLSLIDQFITGEIDYHLNGQSVVTQTSLNCV